MEKDKIGMNRWEIDKITISWVFCLFFFLQKWDNTEPGRAGFADQRNDGPRTENAAMCCSCPRLVRVAFAPLTVPEVRGPTMARDHGVQKQAGGERHWELCRCAVSPTRLSACVNGDRRRLGKSVRDVWLQEHAVPDCA